VVTVIPAAKWCLATNIVILSFVNDNFNRFCRHLFRLPTRYSVTNCNETVTSACYKVVHTVAKFTIKGTV